MREYSNMKAIILDMYGVIVKQTGDNFMKKKVIAIILVVLSIMLVSACGSKEEMHEVPNLSQYKTDYVGNATLTLKDILPYEIDEELSSFDGCTYENKILIGLIIAIIIMLVGGLFPFKP